MPAVTISALGSLLLIAPPTVWSMARYWAAFGFLYQYWLRFGSFQICQAVIGFGFGLPCQTVPFGP